MVRPSASRQRDYGGGEHEDGEAGAAHSPRAIRASSRFLERFASATSRTHPPQQLGSGPCSVRPGYRASRPCPPVAVRRPVVLVGAVPAVDQVGELGHVVVASLVASSTAAPEARLPRDARRRLDRSRWPRSRLARCSRTSSSMCWAQTTRPTRSHCRSASSASHHVCARCRTCRSHPGSGSPSALCRRCCGRTGCRMRSTARWPAHPARDAGEDVASAPPPLVSESGTANSIAPSRQLSKIQLWWTRASFMPA